MNPMTPHSESLALRALELYDAGLSQCEVARQLGVARQTVRRWVVPGAREKHNASIRNKRNLRSQT